MTWSDWVQEPDGSVTPFRRLIGYPPDLVDAFDDAEWWIGSSISWNGVQFRAGLPPFPPFPAYLLTLTEGVDYAIKPGADPDSGFADRFVEYEDAPAEWLRWEWLNGVPTITLRLDDPIGPGSGFVSILTPTDYDDVDQFPSIPDFQGEGLPVDEPVPSGIVFDTFSDSVGPGWESVTPPDPGPVEAFTLVTAFDFLSTDDGRYYFTTGDPVAFYRPRRYRYWIPGDLPLRQFHRDDGMGGTPPRAFGGTSRIQSGRQFGHD